MYRVSIAGRTDVVALLDAVLSFLFLFLFFLGFLVILFCFHNSNCLNVINLDLLKRSVNLSRSLV